MNQPLALPPDVLPAEDVIDLYQYWRLFRRWWWALGLAFVLGALAAYGFSKIQQPVYRAETRILVSQAASSDLTDTYRDILVGERLVKTYAEIITSDAVLDRVAEIVGEEALESADITVSPVKETQLLTVQVEHTDPEIAATIANEIMRVFSEYMRQVQTQRFAESKANLQAQLTTLQSEIEQLQEQLAALGTPETDAERAQQQQLQALLTQQQAAYTSLLRSFEEVRLAEAQAVDTILVVDPATPPENPVRPRVLFNTLLGGVLALVAAAGLIVLIEMLDDRIRSPEVVERLTDYPLLGMIAHIDAADAGHSLVVREHPRDPVSEAYRVVRTNLQFAEVQSPIRTLVVTSAGPGEGKTTTAANLALAMAQAGRKVVLVDADLRKPMQHQVFGLSNAQGLTSALMHPEIAADRFLQRVDAGGGQSLWVMPSGPVPPNPAEVVGARRMQELLDELATFADVVVLDTPPVLVVADPALLAQMSDGVLLVTRLGVTHEQGMKRALEQLRYAEARVVGIVVNDMTARDGGYYYQYYHTYYHEDGQNGAGGDTGGVRKVRKRTETRKNRLAKMFSLGR